MVAASDSNALPQGWQRVRAENVALPGKGAIVSGPFGSNIGKRFFVDEGVPVIRGSNLTLGEKELVVDGFVFITQEKAHQLRGSEALRGDIVFTAAGTLGQVGRIHEKSRFQRYIVSNKQLRLRCNPNISDSKYLYYWFSSPWMRTHIANQNTGASIPLISLSTLRNMPVNLPPLPVQRWIAGILSAYDELMGNNRRRIRLLEAMARALYREWFVRPCQAGNLPKGWEIKPAKEILARRAAGTVYRETDVKPEGAVPVIDQSTNELLGLHDNEPDHLGSPAKPIAIFGDHTCKMQLLIEPFSVGPNVVPFTAIDGLPTAYVFYVVNSLVETQEYKRHWIPLNAKEVVVADSSTAQRFASKIQPMLEAQEALRKVTRNLRRTRNLLLPRLLSGRVNMTGLELAS